MWLSMKRILSWWYFVDCGHSFDKGKEAKLRSGDGETGKVNEPKMNVLSSELFVVVHSDVETSFLNVVQLLSQLAFFFFFLFFSPSSVNLFIL